jgi:flagellar biogenesis protein FliO
MQLKYNRQPKIGNTLFRILVKLILVIVVLIFTVFLIEKIKFPSPEKKFKIDVTNEIKKL